MNPRVTQVEAQGNYTLNVTFRTGERRRFDTTPYLARGVFTALRNRSRFRAARVVAGSVEWPGEIDLSYDTLYAEGKENLVGVVFDPWVGSKYESSDLFGVRVLVLGESHYGKPSELCTAFTTDVVRRWAQAHRDSFFTKVSKVLLGLDENTWLAPEPRAEIWEHVAFYNYVQELVGDRARRRPTAQMWTAAAPPFLGILRELNPDAVLVLGKALEQNLPADFPQQIAKARIYHPSSGVNPRTREPYFNHKTANPIFAELIATARSRRLSCDKSV